MALLNDVEPQLMQDVAEDDLIAEYFARGYKYSKIVALLQSYQGISMSVRTLKRRLRTLNLKRHKGATDTDIQEALTTEIELHGNRRGYRQMTSVLRVDYGMNCSQKQIQATLRAFDPAATELRRSRRLHRRIYNVPGPMFIWHVDGYDKMKPHGFAIHGAIDGYSRKIMWLKVAYTNNNPEVIASYYMEAIERYNVPQKLRTDAGTENGTMAGIHSYFHQSSTSHMYGTSQQNQRIEALWGKLRPSIDEWKTFFAGKDIDLSDEVKLAAIRFSFMPLIKNTLKQFKAYWNTHHIRQSSSMPGGVPDNLFFDGSDQNLSTVPSAHELEQAKASSQEPSITGHEGYDEIFTEVQADMQLIPKTKDEAFHLYEHLVAYASE